MAADEKRERAAVKVAEFKFVYDMKQILPKKYVCIICLINKYVTNMPIEKGKSQIKSKCFKRQ